MKYAFKRFGLLLTALLFLFSTICGLSPVASAMRTEQTAQTDPYVFWYLPSGLTVDYSSNVPYFYISPFAVDHMLIQEDGIRYTSGSCFPKIVNLINTTKLESSGERAYASVAAYCVDTFMDLRENTSYRRVNLEEAAYLETGTAEALRAVVLHSYPRKTIKALQVRANAWLRRQGLPEIADLQSGEALLATQAVIWKLVNGDRYVIHTLYSGREEWETGESLVIDTSTLYQQETEHTAQNVESLYNYLYNLEAEEPRYSAISEASFEALVYTGEEEADGTYTVTAAVTLNATVSKQDSLILSAACGGQMQSQAITEAGEYSFLFKGLPEQDEVKLEVNGWQYGRDVYLFEAAGEHDATLIGYDSSLLPVHGETLLGHQPAESETAGDQSDSGDAVNALSNIQALAAYIFTRNGTEPVHKLSADRKNVSETGPDIPMDNTVKVMGTPLSLSETGSMDTTVINVLGITVIGSACLLLFGNRNRKA